MIKTKLDACRFYFQTLHQDLKLTNNLMRLESFIESPKTKIKRNVSINFTPHFSESNTTTSINLTIISNDCWNKRST